MGKTKQSSDIHDEHLSSTFGGESNNDSPELKKTGDLKKLDSFPKGKKYKVIFRQNRSFELHVGRKVYMFGPHGVMTLPKAIINHPDFKQQINYFTVVEE